MTRFVPVPSRFYSVFDSCHSLSRCGWLAGSFRFVMDVHGSTMVLPRFDTIHPIYQRVLNLGIENMALGCQI